MLVVGDKFTEFTAGKDVLSLSQLRGLLALPPEMVLGKALWVLVPGQGLGDEDVAGTLALVEASPLRDNFDLKFWRDYSKRAENAHTHKFLAQNTMVSEPRRITDDRFELDLMVDENCELMGDHQTGQHLQGMLIVEAARQAFLAVTEAYLLPENKNEFYFIFDRLHVDFKRFVFPFDVRMLCSVREKEEDTSSRRFLLDLLLEQAGATVATVTAAFTVVKNKSIRRIESSLARETLTAHLASLVSQQDEAVAGAPGVNWAAQ